MVKKFNSSYLLPHSLPARYYIAKGCIFSKLFNSSFISTFVFSTAGSKQNKTSCLSLRFCTVVSYQSERFSSKWELPFLPPSSLELWREERARKAALILMKRSRFDQTLQYLTKGFSEWSIVFANAYAMRTFFFQIPMFISNTLTFHSAWDVMDNLLQHDVLHFIPHKCPICKLVQNMGKWSLINLSLGWI